MSAVLRKTSYAEAVWQGPVSSPRDLFFLRFVPSTCFFSIHVLVYMSFCSTLSVSPFSSASVSVFSCIGDVYQITTAGYLKRQYKRDNQSENKSSNDPVRQSRHKHDDLALQS